MAAADRAGIAGSESVIMRDIPLHDDQADPSRRRSRQIAVSIPAGKIGGVILAAMTCHGGKHTGHKKRWIYQLEHLSLKRAQFQLNW